jgi:glutathione S-transferase
MLEASPKGTVPVLVWGDGEVLDESLNIMRWALRRYDPEGWLARHDGALVATNDGAFKGHLDRYKYPERHAAEPLVHRESGLNFLRELDARLSVGGQLGGTRRGFADAAIMPFVRQFAAVDQAWFADQPLPHLRRWLDSHLTSDLFKAVMMRVEPWSPNDAPVLTPSCRSQRSPL